MAAPSGGPSALSRSSRAAGAIVEPYVLDARRCLSYLTIEQKKAIPDVHAAVAGSQVYGCDICQDVCPWNQAPLVSDAPEWLPRPARMIATACSWL